RETVELTFPAVSGSTGLVVAARNSLLNTFLFYQALAYLGRQAGDWMTKLEKGDEKVLQAVKGVGDALGDIDVSVLTRAGWGKAGAFSETGPIAREVQLVPFPADLPPGPIQVRLSLTRGNWKIDALWLAELGAPVEPTSLSVREILRDGKPDGRALQRLQ